MDVPARLLHFPLEVVGLYHPLFLAVKLHESLEPQEDAKLREQHLREYEAQLAACQARYGDAEIQERFEALPEGIHRAVLRFRAILDKRSEVTEAVREELMAEAFRFLINWAIEDPGLREQRQRCLRASARLNTVVHECAHLMLSCSSPVQSFWNWLLWIQATYVRRFLRDTTEAGGSPRAPLLRLLPEAGTFQSSDPRALLVVWCAIEELLDVLGGVALNRWPDHSAAHAVFIAAEGERHFRFWADAALRVRLPETPWPESRGASSCPVDLDGKPYGINAIQEGYAAVAANTLTALSHYDLLALRPNDYYHGPYFSLPALAAARLGILHPTVFHDTFLALCDVAMASHLHPACAEWRHSEFSASWEDLHPGWRFHAALEIVARDDRLLILDAERDYPRLVGAICDARAWPTPLQVTRKVMEFNRSIDGARALSPMVRREIVLAERRERIPHLLCSVEELVGDQVGPVALSRERGQWGVADEAEFRHCLAHWYLIDFTRKAMLATRHTLPEPFEKGIPMREMLERSTWLQTGCSVDSLWPSP